MESDREAEGLTRLARQALPDVQSQIQHTSQKLRDEYGVHVNYVAPVSWQGQKVYALGSRVYFRPPSETFHEFLIQVLQETIGEEWRAEQAQLSERDQHFIFRASNEYGKWKAANSTDASRAPDGHFAATPSGWVQYFISLAWDVATLIHASNLPESLLERLRDQYEFQGARYEIAIAAIFARLDCTICFLNEEEGLQGSKHAEFIATHRPTAQEVAVETKSRRRPGILNEAGEFDRDDPLRGDPRAVRRRFLEALEQAPEGLPFMVFIDINAPLQLDAETGREWLEDIRRWMDRLPSPSREEPSVYNAFCVTNFSPHFQGVDVARGSEWLMVKPLYVEHPLRFDLTGMLSTALDMYHRVPEIAAGGEVRA
jgi:hypothetical protein